MSANERQSGAPPAAAEPAPACEPVGDGLALEAQAPMANAAASASAPARRVGLNVTLILLLGRRSLRGTLATKGLLLVAPQRSRCAVNEGFAGG
jgi:hypothetical protein